jgi:uncharacterized protein (TIGR02452 family)
MDHTSEVDRAPRRRQAQLVQSLATPWESSPARLVAAAPSMIPVRQHLAFTLSDLDSRAAASGVPGVAGVLVFGSHRRPGGGWLNGARAQEEDISLFSSWAVQAAACPEFYASNDPLGPSSALIAQGAWLLDAHGRPLATPQPVVFGGVAAPNCMDAVVKAHPGPVLRDALATRLVGMLDAWQGLGVTHAVLGAIGAGVFQWPAQASAEAVLLACRCTQWQGEIVLALPSAVQRAEFEKVWASARIQPSRKGP